MGRRPGIPVRQRRVSGELRTRRKNAHLTCADVARGLGCSVSKVSRMETGARGLYPDEVAAYLGFLRVPAALREELLALVREGADRNWWQTRNGKLPTSWRNVIRLETDATALRNYESQLVPGLLQIPEYTRAVLAATTEGITDAELDRLTTARLARQALLSRRDAPTLEVILDEAVLRRPVGGPDTMARQLRHLVDAASRPNVGIRVVTFASGANPGLTGAFLILEYPDQDSLVYLEHRDNTGFLEEEQHVRTARVDLRRLRSQALAPEDSVRLIATAAGEFASAAEEPP